MRLIGLLFLILPFTVFATTLDVKVNPDNPVFNEPYTLNFIIKTSEELTEEPFVSFDPLNAEVVSKSDVSTSTQFTYVNGKSSVQRTYTFSYDLISSKPGTAYIRSIVAEVNGQKIRHNTIQLRVLKTTKSIGKIFAQAEVDKTEAYVGESILVRYYIYTRNDVPITSLDIKKFPKLDKYLKRFHQEKSGPERVNYRGKLYVRRIMYTAQLFAEKPGTFKIDPITMSVRYNNRSNSFGSFGLGLQFGKPMTTTVVSKPVEINVLPIPAEGMPASFSGLVGKHEATLKINKNKFIANEPIELTLDITGDGAMELYEAPPLISNPVIEEFEKNADLIINSDFTAVKKINYTYLGRETAELKNEVFEFSYFDPELKEFKIIKLPIGNIKVAGGLNNRGKRPEQAKPNKSDQNIVRNFETVDEPIKLEFKPVFKLLNTFLYTIEEIFILLIVTLFFLISYVFGSKFKNFNTGTKDLYEEMIKSGVNFQHLHKIFKSTDNKSLEEKISSSALKKNTRDYLLDIVNQLQEQYKQGADTQSIKISKKLLNDLRKLKT